jgi:colicin import membrane protein
MKIDQETGEILPENIMPLTDKAPAIILDVSEVAKYHTEPMKLVEKINAQAGYMVFDITTKKGRDACRSHAAQIIKCIAPACKESTRLADEAKKIVNQSLTFRKLFDAGVREIAEYHRKPLTEWEQEQERIAENERLFAEKMESMRLYQLDWDDAIAYDELFTLRKEKAAREAEQEALKYLQEQEEYEKQLQAQAIIKERERHEKEIDQLKRDQEAELIKQVHEKYDRDVKGLEKPLIDKVKEQKEIEFIEDEKNMFSDTVTISKTEYLILKSDSARLHQIIKLWQQANRMTESANRADQSSVRNEELRDAQKVRLEAIALIENIKI